MSALFFFLPQGVNPILGFWLPIAAFLFAIITQSRVHSTFKRFSSMTTRSGLTGAEVAELLLRSRGITDVRVEATRGFLSDHYNPFEKTLRLSEAVHGSRSVAALGIAAHETGHALQHADSYAWLNLRSRMVPAVSALSRLGSMLLPIGMILLIFTRSQSPFAITLLWGAAVGLAAVVAFSLVTLPVEIDASRRALKLLGNAGILVEGEMPGARAVLNAAAWTYVAAAAAAIIELLRVLAILSAAGRGRSSS